MSYWLLWSLGLGYGSAVMFGLWLVYLKRDRPDIVDVGWGFVILSLGLVFCTLASGWAFRRLALAVLVTIWAGRLSWYLFVRWSTSEEDGRYLKLRQSWVAHPRFAFLVFFQAQAIIASLLMLPVLGIAMTQRVGMSVLEWFGLVIFAVALIGETISDAQLARFKRDNPNTREVCQIGLWRYSRHPNYFFQWLAWVAIAFLGLASDWGWLSLVSPLVMLVLLIGFSGIPPAEAQSLKSRGVAYREYQKRTSAFIPWFPKG